MDNLEFIWAQKYRPTTIDECILPESLKEEFKIYVDKGSIPNFLMCSKSPGTGKTTLAKALCSEINCDVLFVNASSENGIANLRTNVTQFVSAVSLNGGLKVVILDEADNLSNDAQMALRGLMEQFSANARFILTCNNERRISQPIVSRCTKVDFAFSNNDLKVCARDMFRRSMEILKNEGVSFEKPALAGIIEKFVPDNRTILNKIQTYATRYGMIDDRVLQEIKNSDTSTLIDHVKNKKFKDIKNWVFENGSTLGADFYGKFYRECVGKVKPASEPEIIWTVADYQKWHDVVSDIQIHILAFLLEIAGNNQVVFE